MVPHERERPLKQLQVCPRCGAYMRPSAPFRLGAVTREWKDESLERSFGGIGVRRFMCEKCHHVEIFQIDELAHLDETEDASD